jgi:hypothetical protein
MSINHFTEEGYEQALIQLFQDLGYAYECGYDVERDHRNPYYEVDLRAGLRRMNPMLREDVLEEAFRMVTHINEGTLDQRNGNADRLCAKRRGGKVCRQRTGQDRIGETGGF